MLRIIYSILFVMIIAFMLKFWPLILLIGLFIWVYKKIKKPKNTCEVISKENIKTKDLEGMDMALHISKKTNEKK